MNTAMIVALMVVILGLLAYPIVGAGRKQLSKAKRLGSYLAVLALAGAVAYLGITYMR